MIAVERAASLRRPHDRHASRLDDPQSALRRALPSLDRDPTPGELREQGLDDVAVRAGDRPGSREQVQARTRVFALSERLRTLDAKADRRGERLERLHAPQVRARDETRDPTAAELIDEPDGLTLPAVAQWPQPVIAGPRLAVAGVGVADEERGAVD